MSTTTRRRSITKTHERISQLGWEPDYFQPAEKYPTRYTFPIKAKDPMKHIMREYLPMELEKDERVYGGQDAAVRAEMTSKTGRRWMEIIKPYIVTTAYAEVGAGRCMSMLIDAIPNNELRNGYHVQFVDEIRHTGLQMALARWYAKHVPDPSGWHLGPATLSKDPGTRQALNMLSHFIVGDPVQCAFTLMVVAETAFTNIAFVALPDVGARNGDFTLPTTYLSVQSDEARHISNGYATLLTVLQEDDNAPLIERDLAQAWWINHAYLDGFGSAIMEYSSDDRSDPESYLDKWERWIENDWYRSYVLKLGKLGLNFPAEMFDRREVAARARHGPQEHARLGRVLDAPLLAHRRRSTSATSNGSSPSTRAGTRSTAPPWEAFRADQARPAAVQAPAEHGAGAGSAVVLGLPDGLRVPRGHVPPHGRRPHALLLLEGVHVARRVEPRPLRRRPQLLRPLPRVGAVGGRARPRLRAHRRQDADRAAAPRQRQHVDARRREEHGLPRAEPEHHGRGEDGPAERLLGRAGHRRTATSTAA